MLRVCIQNVLSKKLAQQASYKHSYIHLFSNNTALEDNKDL